MKTTIWEFIDTRVAKEPILRYVDTPERLTSVDGLHFFIRGRKRLIIWLTCSLGKGSPVCVYCWPEERRLMACKQRWSERLFNCPDGCVLEADWLPKYQMALIKSSNIESISLPKLFWGLFTPDEILDPFSLDLHPSVEKNQMVSWWQQRHQYKYSPDISGIIFGQSWVVAVEKCRHWLSKLPEIELIDHTSKTKTNSAGAGAGAGACAEIIGTKEGERRLLWLAPDTSGLPDVWYIGNTPDTIGKQLAYIGSLELSKAMNELDHSKAIQLECQWVTRFNKWKPMVINRRFKNT